MLNLIELKYDFSQCTPTELEILLKYWDCDKNGVYSTSLKNIANEYNFKQEQIYNLAHKYPLEWHFQDCGCGNPIIAKLTKRRDLISCINKDGCINTYRSFNEFKKCENCSAKEFRNYIDYNEWEARFAEESKTPVLTNETLESIKKLSPFELKLLYQLYELRNFNLIKYSNKIFPVKHGELRTFVWKTIYKLDELKLISAIKSGSYINNIEFYNTVADTLESLQSEFQPIIEHTDLELTLVKILEGHKTKYLTILEPETDIILKAGNRYEFIANGTDDKNIILRIINLNSLHITSPLLNAEVED